MTNKKPIIRKRINIALGFISLGLAYIGIALPGVPGTPFILLTAFFFVRSSDKMYNWLLRKKIFAKIINKFNDNEKLPLTFKLFVIMQLWISISVALIWFVNSYSARLIIFIIGIFCSILILFIKKIKLKE
ncbi:MAG: YbaN family protein [Bacteroidales bacterium]|nr:YbaN family protein [Bacteroidales bacterium]